jgi:proline iminopeptidase
VGVQQITSLEKPAVEILYPEIEPNHTGRLKVSGVHEIYYEECGSPHGKPVIFLHGGPGTGVDTKHRRYFNPKKYRIILFDQRGCGKSTPHASLEENTTWDLVDDIEKLRKHLKIDKWLVYGRSWGSTLALAYAETYPQATSELVVGGIFLCRQQELDWLYQRGASALFPDAWEDFLKPIPENERGDMLKAYHKRLTSDDPNTWLSVAKAWSLWEAGLCYFYRNEEFIAQFSVDHAALSIARIECHYFINKGFWHEDNQLLKDAQKIKHIPCVIVQGRYDVVCPMESAWALHKALPKSELVIVADAGHGSSEPGIAKAMMDATDKFVS